MHPMVAETIPLALGDSYEAYRIVGSTPALLDHYGVTVVQGENWGSTYEVVVGSQVAEAEGINIGDTIISAHDLPSMGRGKPSVYEVDGRQFVVVSASNIQRWGQSLQVDFEDKTPQYIAFALPITQP